MPAGVSIQIRPWVGNTASPRLKGVSNSRCRPPPARSSSAVSSPKATLGRRAQVEPGRIGAAVDLRRRPSPPHRHNPPVVAAEARHDAALTPAGDAIPLGAQNTISRTRNTPRDVAAGRLKCREGVMAVMLRCAGRSAPARTAPLEIRTSPLVLVHQSTNRPIYPPPTETSETCQSPAGASPRRRCGPPAPPRRGSRAAWRCRPAPGCRPGRPARR